MIQFALIDIDSLKALSQQRLLLSALVNKRRLEHITFIGAFHGPLFEYIEQPSLTTATIVYRRQTLTETTASYKLPACLRFTSIITSLTLGVLSDQSLSNALAFPADLSELNVRLDSHLRFAPGNLAAVQCALEQQAHSLKTISLEGLKNVVSQPPHPESIIPYFSAFPSLECVELSGSDIFNEPPADAIRKLSAPQLTEIKISVETFPKPDSGPSGFAEEFVNWLRAFATFRKESGLASSLAIIELKFDTD